MSMLYLSFSQMIVDKVSCPTQQTYSKQYGKCMYQCSDDSTVDSLSQCQQLQSNNSDDDAAAVLIKVKMVLMIISCIFLFVGIIAMVWKFKKWRDFFSNRINNLQDRLKNLLNRENKYLLPQQNQASVGLNVKAQTNEIYTEEKDDEGYPIKCTIGYGMKIQHALEGRQTINNLLSKIQQKLIDQKQGIQDTENLDYMIELDNQKPIVFKFRAHNQQ